MDTKWQKLLGNALANNTKRTYSSAQRLFISFCTKHNLLHDNGSPCPASELTILRFIGEISDSRQASTLKVYLSAVRALHVQMGFLDPFLNRPRIPMVIKGLRRSQSSTKRPEKLPITALVLYSLKLQLDLTKKDDLMFWAVCCTAFFGFLRAAEFTVPSSGFQSGLHLSLADVSVDSYPLPSTAFVHLAHSKTDQFGKGYSIVLARSDGHICPVAALMSYLQCRGSQDGPLFVFADGSPLTRPKLNARLQALLAAAGWQGRYTLHSFRVGAATTAASLGFPDYLIQAMGRWSSDAYKVYIKLPQQRLKFASKSLATATLFPSV